MRLCRSDSSPNAASARSNFLPPSLFAQRLNLAKLAFERPSRCRESLLHYPANSGTAQRCFRRLSSLFLRLLRQLPVQSLIQLRPAGTGRSRSPPHAGCRALPAEFALSLPAREQANISAGTYCRDRTTAQQGRMAAPGAVIAANLHHGGTAREHFHRLHLQPA